MQSAMVAVFASLIAVGAASEVGGAIARVMNEARCGLDPASCAALGGMDSIAGKAPVDMRVGVK